MRKSISIFILFLSVFSCFAQETKEQKKPRPIFEKSLETK
jgi:hypothetical protein